MWPGRGENRIDAGCRRADRAVGRRGDARRAFHFGYMRRRDEPVDADVVRRMAGVTDKKLPV